MLEHTPRIGGSDHVVDKLRLLARSVSPDLVFLSETKLHIYGSATTNFFKLKDKVGFSNGGSCRSIVLLEGVVV